MNFETLSLFILTEALLSLSPGPAVLLVLGLSVRHGFKIGFGSTLGIITTNAVYFTFAALGVSAMILASAVLFTVIKWLGAAYLAYLGLQMLAPLIKRLKNPKSNVNQAIDVQKAAQAYTQRDQRLR